MVGMSGKTSEPRRGASSQHKKLSPTAKAQPSAEALHVAKILGDKYPSDLSDKIAQVTSVVPGRSEEEVCIALHDHDFDPAKAISALLDSDSQDGSQGQQWTTTGRKSRKSRGGEGASDLIIAPGDRSQGPGKPSGRGTSKAASQSVREGYGGSVTVSSDGGKGRGKGRPASTGRGRSSSSSGRREEKGGRNKGRAPRGSGRNKSRPTPTTTAPPEQSSTEDKTPVVATPTEMWEDMEPQPSTEWGEQEHLDPVWDRDEEGKPSPPVFPEAIPFPPSTASSAQPTSSTDTSPPRPRDPSPVSFQALEPDMFMSTPSPPSSSSTRHRSRHKRLARSQIPSQPVEMPQGTYPEISELGIAFVGLDLHSHNPLTDRTLEEVATSQDSTPMPLPSEVATTTASSLLTSYSAQFPEDAGVITITAPSTYTASGGTTKLEAPPGLPHPVASGLPYPVAAGGLPHSAVSGGLPLATAAVSTQSQTGSAESAGQLLPPEPISLPSTLSSLPSTSTSLPPLPQSIELPPPTTVDPAPTLTTATDTPQLLSHTFPTVSSSGAELLSGSSQAPPSSAAAPPSSKHALPQHSTAQQSKHGAVQQQPMIYPYMLQPPVMMPMSMSAYYDPEMNRYPASVSMAYYQHPTTSDPSMATGITRDHGSTGFTSDGGKFVRGSDIPTSTAPSNPSQTQQQGGLQQNQQMGHAAFLNAYYGGNVIYPMYHGYSMPGFSAPSLGPKPSAGSTYPGGSGYQAPSGFGYEDVASAGHDYSKMYTMQGSLGKSSSMPSTSADMATGSSYKHQPFDSKASSSYSGYNVPQGGYGFIPTAPLPVQMPPYLPTHEGQARGQKKSYVSSQLWSQGSHHTS